jgi:hypothetical protein
MYLFSELILTHENNLLRRNWIKKNEYLVEYVNLLADPGDFDNLLPGSCCLCCDLAGTKYVFPIPVCCSLDVHL